MEHPPRAHLRETEDGLVAEGDGWFTANVRNIAWESVEGGGAWCPFEAENTSARASLGVGVHVLLPGDAPGFYHEESDQEGFLVLAGECVLVVEGEERSLRQWDYFHCPAGTRHITVGAGDEPCAIFMVGARTPGKSILYPVDPVAEAHGVSVARETSSPKEAYAERAPIRRVRAPDDAP